MYKRKDIILRPKNVKIIFNGQEFQGLLVSSKSTNTGVTHRVVTKFGELSIHVAFLQD